MFSGAQADAQIAGDVPAVRRQPQGPVPPVNPRAGRARTPPYRLPVPRAHVPDRQQPGASGTQRHMRYQMDYDEGPPCSQNVRSTPPSKQYVRI